MRIRGIVVSLLAVPVLVPPPAGAVPVEVGQQAIVSTHAPGMPTTTDRSRALSSATAETDWLTGDVELTAELAGGGVALFQQATVTWQLGRWTPSGDECVPEETATATVYGDGYGGPVMASRSWGDVPHDLTCLEVSLTTQGEVSDRVRGGWTTRVVQSGAEADLAGSADGSTTPTRVLAGRSTRTLAVVTSHALPSERVTVSGTGTAAIRPFSVSGLGADDVRPVVVRVRARTAGPARLDLQARDERGDATYDGRSTVRVVPVHGRPSVGVFRDSRSLVRLRVDRTGRVRGLVGWVGTCGAEDDTMRWGSVVRLPRAGATAAVRRTDTGWDAVSLVTTGDRAISGVLVRTGTQCSATLPFVVRLKR